MIRAGRRRAVHRLDLNANVPLLTVPVAIVKKTRTRPALCSCSKPKAARETESVCNSLKVMVDTLKECDALQECRDGCCGRETGDWALPGNSYNLEVCMLKNFMREVFFPRRDRQPR